MSFPALGWMGIGASALFLLLASQAAGAQNPASPAQAPITPAPPAYTGSPNSTVFPSIFPESGTAIPSTGRASSRESGAIGAATLGAGLGSGPIHPGDLVEVQIFDAPEFSTSMPVSPDGDIAIPYAGIFHISGMTSKEAAAAIARLFQDRQILRDPHVIVMTRQFGNTVTIFGEVRAPGMYPLTGQQRLVDVLTEAGGVTDRAGHIIRVFDTDSPKDPKILLWDPTYRENENAFFKLKIGQTVMVSRCGVVFVGGNVVRPGAFPLCDTQHMTISQAIALAGSIRPSSYGQRTLLIRTSSTGTRIVQQLRLEDVLRGKAPDILLADDDIVFIPPSTLKATAKILGQAAIGFATEAFFFYGNNGF